MILIPLSVCFFSNSKVFRSYSDRFFQIAKILVLLRSHLVQMQNFWNLFGSIFFQIANFRYYTVRFFFEYQDFQFLFRLFSFQKAKVLDLPPLDFFKNWKFYIFTVGIFFSKSEISRSYSVRLWVFSVVPTPRNFPDKINFFSWCSYERNGSSFYLIKLLEPPGWSKMANFIDLSFGFCLSAFLYYSVSCCFSHGKVFYIVFSSDIVELQKLLDPILFIFSRLQNFWSYSFF